MSDINENVIEEKKEWQAGNDFWVLILLAMIFGFGGWGSYENPRISELEKKVARLEGQMSMIGGKRFE